MVEPSPAPPARPGPPTTPVDDRRGPVLPGNPDVIGRSGPEPAGTGRRPGLELLDVVESRLSDKPGEAPIGELFGPGPPGSLAVRASERGDGSRTHRGLRWGRFRLRRSPAEYQPAKSSAAPPTRLKPASAAGLPPGATSGEGP